MRREEGRREGNIAVSAATLRLRGSSSSSSAAAELRRLGELHTSSLAPMFPIGRAGTFRPAEMAYRTMGDCFYRRGIPKMRRSPVTSCCLV